MEPCTTPEVWDLGSREPFMITCWVYGLVDNQELTIDNRAASVENLCRKPNWQLERMLSAEQTDN